MLTPRMLSSLSTKMLFSGDFPVAIYNLLIFLESLTLLIILSIADKPDKSSRALFGNLEEPILT